MKRKFKMVGVLMTVTAMFALAASAAQAQFTSSFYPTFVNSGSVFNSGDVFDAFGTTVKCSTRIMNGELTAASDTLTISPEYDSCTAFGLPATVNFTGCSYLFHEETRTVDIACPKGKQIDIMIYSSAAHTTQICALGVPAQTGKSGYSLENTIVGTIRVSGTVGSLTANVVHDTSIACPNGPTTNEAKYTIQSGGFQLSGSSGSLSVD